MKIAIDTHTHTLASGHAYSTLREMAQMAAQKGLEGLAITEHAPEMPGTCHLYYFQNMSVIPREMYGVELLIGAELNIMNAEGDVDLPPNIIRELDIAIASLHTPCYRGALTKEEVTRAYVKAMNKEDVDIIGHPDDGRAPVDYETLVKEAKRTGTLLEVNNSSLRPESFRENAYENDQMMLRLCKEYGTRIVLGSDAHVDTDIARYDNVEKILRETEFPEELIANTSLQKLKASLKRNKKL